MSEGLRKGLQKDMGATCTSVTEKTIGYTLYNQGLYGCSFFSMYCGWGFHRGLGVECITIIFSVTLVHAVPRSFWWHFRVVLGSLNCSDHLSYSCFLSESCLFLIMRCFPLEYMVEYMVTKQQRISNHRLYNEFLTQESLTNSCPTIFGK